MEEKLKVGRIYKIIDNTNGNIYIGSTTQKLNQRFNNHKNSYNNFINNKQGYCTYFDIIKNNNCEIELIKFVIFKDKIELFQRERYYIENNNCINQKLPSRSRKEYARQRYICECGIDSAHDNKWRHEKSQRHINFINSK